MSLIYLIVPLLWDILHCFPFVVIINDTVMNVHVHKPLGTFLIIPQVSLCRLESCLWILRAHVWRSYIPLQKFNVYYRESRMSYSLAFPHWSWRHTALRQVNMFSSALWSCQKHCMYAKKTQSWEELGNSAWALKSGSPWLEDWTSPQSNVSTSASCCKSHSLTFPLLKNLGNTTHCDN